MKGALFKRAPLCRSVFVKTVFLWLRLINLVNHFLQIIHTLFLAFEIVTANDIPTSNDVYTIIVIIAVKITTQVNCRY